MIVSEFHLYKPVIFYTSSTLLIFIHIALDVYIKIFKMGDLDVITCEKHTKTRCDVLVF